MTAPPALILSGRTLHARHVAPRRRFAYRIWMLAFDLDRIDEAVAAIPGLTHNRFGLVALHDRDHGARDGTPLRDWAAARLAEAGLSAYAARIHFVVIPRVLGYGFNPIACYFCHDSQGTLGAILHQVKNTFGDQHTYLLPIEHPAAQAGEQRHAATKRLHVSPFFDLDGGYRFTCRAPDFTRPDFPNPGDLFSLAIAYGTASERRLTAVLRLRATPLTTASLARQLAAMPLLPFKVIAAIHWQALKLWWRGARFHRAPAPPPEPASLGVSA